MKCEKSGNHTISYQSLLLSTTVLNDIASTKYSGKTWQITISSFIKHTYTLNNAWKISVTYQYFPTLFTVLYTSVNSTVEIIEL